MLWSIFFCFFTGFLPRPFESGAGEKWMSSLCTKKTISRRKQFGTSEAQKEPKEMPQQSVQDETKNGDDDRLETFVVQTA